MNRYYVWTVWFVTDLCLAAGLTYWPDMLYITMLVVALHSLHFYSVTPKVWSFPMQVRIIYFAFLVLGQHPYLRWINWIQLAGTTALITVDYCPLARMLSLIPWNRTRTLNWKFIKAAVFSRPVYGSIIDAVSPELVSKLHPERNYANQPQL